MESNQLPEDELPVQLLESIAKEAYDVAKEKSVGRSLGYKNGYADGYFIGATSYATWKIKYDELVQENERLKELIERINNRAINGRPNDLGMGTKQAQMLAEIEDLITDFTESPKAGTPALKEGESNTPAPVQGCDYLTRAALEKELWIMLPDDCRDILAPLKKSYIESLMADIDSYCEGVKKQQA